MLELDVYGSGIDSKMVRFLMELPIEQVHIMNWKRECNKLQRVEKDVMDKMAYGLPVVIAN